MSKPETPADVILAPTAEAERPRVDSDLPMAFGKYTLTRRLGRGGMAEAFMAQTVGASGFQKTLVIKRMLDHLAQDEGFVRMFQREARLAALLTHTNVVQIYELGEIEGVQFIGMEYVDGAPLHNLARGAWSNGLSVPLEVVCTAIADAALGLAAAHELCDERGKRLGVVHRDISPDNLMMNREGVTKILDFGVAKAAGGEKTAAGVVRGKISYLAPEQVLGAAIDGRTDLYALGVTFYGLATGKRPFSGKGDVDTMHRILKGDPRPPCEHNPALPRRVNDLILRMLATNAADRPQDGAEVHDELAEVLASRRTIVVPFVRDFLAGNLAPTAPASGAAFCRSAAVSPALRAWPLCESSGATDDAIGPTPTTASSDLISSTGSGAVGRTATTASAAGEPMSVDDADVEALFDARTAVPAPTTSFTSEDPLTAVWTPPQATHDDGPAFIESTVVAAAPVDPAAPAARRPMFAVIAAVATIVVVGVVAVGFVALRDDAPAPVVGEPVDVVVAAASVVAPVAPSEVAAPAAVEPVAPDVAVEALVPADLEPVEPVAAEAKKPVVKEPRAEVKLQEVQARAPAGIQWQVDGRIVGAGATTLKVPAGTKVAIALDKKRGGRTRVPVVNGVADYAAVPRGKIHPRANPYADVFLGSELLGTTPFPPIEVPVGSWRLRFVHPGKADERRSVDVTPAAIAKISVNFE